MCAGKDPQSRIDEVRRDAAICRSAQKNAVAAVARQLPAARGESLRSVKSTALAKPKGVMSPS